jgi:hypothetical protein
MMMMMMSQAQVLAKLAAQLSTFFQSRSDSQAAEGSGATTHAYETVLVSAIMLLSACLQANSQAQEWFKVAAQLSVFSLKLTGRLQKSWCHNQCLSNCAPPASRKYVFLNACRSKARFKCLCGIESHESL